MPRIYIISQNDSNLGYLKRALANFPTINLVTINASHVKAGVIDDYVKQLESGDLIILDASGEFPWEALNAGLLWAKNQRQVVNAAVLIVLPSFPPAEGPEFLSGADVVISAEALQSKEGLHAVIGQLYRSFRPGNQRLFDTEDVLELMASRARSLVISEIFHSCVQPEDSNENKKLEYKSEALATHLITYPQFNFDLANRILSELPPLLWVCLTEKLASQGYCDFAALGHFERSFAADTSPVLFKPETGFSKMFVPNLSISVEGLADKGARTALNLCFPYLPIKLYELLSAGRKSGTATSLFADLLSDISEQLFHDLQPYRENWPVLSFADSNYFNEPWAQTLSDMAAFAGYYFTIASASRAIHEHGRFDVRLIGEFSLEKEEAIFAPAPELLELLEANPLAKSAST